MSWLQVKFRGDSSESGHKEKSKKVYIRAEKHNTAKRWQFNVGVKKQINRE